MYATYNGSRSNFYLQFNSEADFEDHVSHIKYAVIYASKYGLLGLLKELAKSENQIGEPNYHLALAHCSHLETANYLIDDLGADISSFNFAILQNFIRFNNIEGFTSILNRFTPPTSSFIDVVDGYLDFYCDSIRGAEERKSVFEDYKTKCKWEGNNV